MQESHLDACSLRQKVDNERQKKAAGGYDPADRQNSTPEKGIRKGSLGKGWKRDSNTLFNANRLSVAVLVPSAKPLNTRDESPWRPKKQSLTAEELE
jgi:hypothetical protein